MNSIWNHIWKEKHEYYADQSAGEFKVELSRVLRQSYAWKIPVNMSGDFISENEFEVSPKWQFVFIKNHEREVSYLKGKLEPDNNRTKVVFTVRPNTIFLILAVMIPIFGVLALNSGCDGA